MRILPPLSVISLLAVCGNAQQYLLSSPPTVDSNGERSSKLGLLARPHIDTFIKKTLSEWNTAGGVSVALVQRSNTSQSGWNIEEKGYGFAKSDGTEMTAHHRFCIASNSKLFTVLGTGLLISNQSLSPRISWNTKIRDIYPEWGLLDPIAMSEATIADAMSHRTGLPRHDAMYGQHDTVESILSRTRHLKPSASFRDAWQYNNLMYMLLSHIPPLVLPSKQPFTRYIKEHILESLGLSSSTYSYQVAKESGLLADGFSRDGLNQTKDFFGRGVPRILKYPAPLSDGGEDGSFKSGAGGLIMSAHDAATWIQTLLLEGRHPTTGEVVIPAEVVKKAASGISIMPSALVGEFPELSPVVYGGGQMSSSYRGHAVIEHGGATTGYKTQITRFPNDGFGLAIFSNDDYFGGKFIEVIKYRIIDEILGLEPIDWNERLKSSAIEQYRDVQSRKIAPPPAEKRHPPTVGHEKLAGLYYNAGYGGLLLSLNEDGSGIPANPADTPTLVAKWDKFWTSHIRLDHFDRDLFNVTHFDVRPIIEESATTTSDKTWISVEDDDKIITAEFAFDEESGEPLGFGITGNFWGAAVDPESSGVSVSERAEVWYERVRN